MGLAMRQVDLERLDRALTTILSPLAHERCDDWRLAVESSVAELLDGDHVVFGLPRIGVPMHVHSMNVGGQPRLRFRRSSADSRTSRRIRGFRKRSASG